MTTWIMEDDEELLELFEAYEEARNQVDKQVPRRGDNQAKWLFTKDYRFLTNWFNPHYILSDLCNVIVSSEKEEKL